MRKTIEHRGSRISYEVRGEGPPVLLIQGVGVHGDGWQPQVEALTEHYTCLWFDNRGMGQSQPAGGPITVEQMTEDAVTLLDVEGMGAAHLVGHSLGGPISLHLALTRRERVRSLSLLCTFANGREAAPLTLEMMSLGLRSRIGPRRARRRAFLRLILPPKAIALAGVDELSERLAPLFGHDLADQPPIVSKQLAAMRAYDAQPRLAELADIPTLVVSAEHDPIAPPRLGQALAAGISGARFVEIPNASHGVPIHLADKINALLLEHLAAAEERVATTLRPG